MQISHFRPRKNILFEDPAQGALTNIKDAFRFLEKKSLCSL